MTPSPRAGLLAVGSLLLGLGAAYAAPSGDVLPGPETPLEVLVGGVLLAGTLAVGYRWPLRSLYALVVAVVLEGAVRKWAVNDIVVFMAKDFLALGIYAAVLPRLGREALLRSRALVVTLGSLILLAVLSAALSDSASQAAIGIRSYVVYVPLLWVAPALLDTPARRRALLGLVVALGIAEAALILVQALAGSGTLNKVVSGAVQGVVPIGDESYIRPAGTFMQVGVAAAFLLIALLAALALVATSPRGAWLWVAFVTVATVGSGALFTGSRVLLATAVPALLAAALALLALRRLLAVIGLAVAVASSALVVVVLFPVLGSGSGLALPAERAIGIDPEVAGAEAGTGAFASRVRPQLDLISEQRAIGHGTGTMTLGAQYVLPIEAPGEGQFTKLAWELGLPELVLFVALLVLLGWSSVWALARENGDRAIKLLAVGMLALLPIWMLVTFTLDYPVVGILLFTVVGVAVAPGEAERA